MGVWMAGESTAVFGRHGAAEVAQELGVELLGALPLLPAIRSGSDAGTPVTHAPAAAAAQSTEDEGGEGAGGWGEAAGGELGRLCGEVEAAIDRGDWDGARNTVAVLS